MKTALSKQTHLSCIATFVFNARLFDGKALSFFVGFVFFLSLANQPTLQACPFCSAPQLSMAEQLAQAETALICKWESGEKPDPEGENFGKTFYIVSEILHPSKKKVMKVGDKIQIDGYRSGTKGDLNLVTGTTDDQALVWDTPQELTALSRKYILELPDIEALPIVRLRYALKHLESPDPLIADDAYTQFGGAPYEQVVQLRKELPRKNIQKWLFSDKPAPQQRRGLYGMMLGLCGDASDAKKMEEMITKNTDEFRLGIDGVMGGYLLLTGEKGLVVLEKTKLTTQGKPGSEGIAVNETFSAISALRFMWTQAAGQIPKKRLRQSMRLVVNNENFTPTAILDLARWEDWEYADKLLKMYPTLKEDDRRIKRTIIAFFLSAEEDFIEAKPGEKQEKLPAHVVKAKKFLADVQKTDPREYEVSRRLYR